MGSASPRRTAQPGGALLPGPAGLWDWSEGWCRTHGGWGGGSCWALHYNNITAQLPVSQACLLLLRFIPEATFCVLVSDSASASQDTQCAVGDGVDMKSNALINSILVSYPKHRNSKNQYMIQINFYNWASLNAHDSQRLRDLDGQCRSTEGGSADWRWVN